jgi:hypothetical protein
MSVIGVMALGISVGGPALVTSTTLPSSMPSVPPLDIWMTLKKSLIPLRCSSVVTLSSQSRRKKAIMAVTKSA